MDGDCGILKSFRDWAYERGETVRATTSFLLAGSTTPDGDVIKPQINSAKTDCWNGKAYTPTNQLTRDEQNMVQTTMYESSVMPMYY